MDVVIYHNPACGTSRNALSLIRDAGIEPTIVEYLRNPPDFAALKTLLDRMGVRARDVLREKEGTYAQLGLAADHWSEDELIRQMVSHPVLINRPIVITASAAALCRPAHRVLDLLK